MIIVTQAQTTEITGDGKKVKGITYTERATGVSQHVELEGVFVQIGLVPNTEWLKGTVELSKHGEIIVFVSRLLPAIRTFIAFPAGVARMNLPRFVIYTFAGSLPWCLGLAYVGQKLGEQWDKDDTLKTWFHRFDFLIGIAGALFIIWWVWRHIKHSRPAHP